MAKISRGNNYNNPNGNMEVKEMIKIKHDNKIKEYISNFNIIKNKCPNNKLKAKDIICFYCVDCIKYSFDNIKEFKNYYKVGKVKYLKEELDE